MSIEKECVRLLCEAWAIEGVKEGQKFSANNGKLKTKKRKCLTNRQKGDTI